MENLLNLVSRFLQENPESPQSLEKKDMSQAYEVIRAKTEYTLPIEFELLYSAFEFPGFNVDPISFFGNLDPRNYEGEGFYNESEYIMTKWMNADFAVAIEKGYLPFTSYWGAYDPVCFDTNHKGMPLVALDHEAILIYGDIVVLEEIDPSLRRFMEHALGR